MLDNHYVPDGYGIIPNFEILGYEVSSYTLFVGIGLLVGLICFFITVVFKEKVHGEKAYLIVMSSLICGFIGSKVLVLIENMDILLNDITNIKYFLYNGKSIVGGLIGGYIGIRLIKKKLNLEGMRVGNKIAPSIALGMAIGRIGCFLTGCCYGIETKLPIGVNFGDGISRIPTQLIEMIFSLILFGYLLYKQLTDKKLVPGILFQKLVLNYFVFRFFIEFIRGTEKNILFLSIYQVICLIGIMFILKKIKKEAVLWKNKPEIR